jgi:hypothetical protein
MMDSALKGPLWMWWCNPLLQMHPDQKKRLNVEKLSRSGTVAYKDIEALRATLSLQITPEPGVFSEPSYVLWALFEPEETNLVAPTICSLTFDDSIAKLSSNEWSELFGVHDKEHVRALLTYGKKAPENLKVLLARINSVCGDWRLSERFSLLERMNLLLSIFFICRFPGFGQRWFLNLSDKVLNAVEKIRENQSPDVMNAFCDFIQPEVEKLIAFIRKKHEVPELNFQALAD